MKQNNDFMKGVYNGLPIALGYIPLAFSFGMLAVNGGYNALVPTIMSILSFTGAGQIAGIKMMLEGASLISLFLVNLVINSRYLVMSLSINKNIDGDISIWKKFFIAFGMTDENFTIASFYTGKRTFSFFLGLILTSFTSWVVGTFVGALVTGFLPEIVREALNITLYAMFCALLLPSVKRNKAVAVVTTIAVAISCMFYFLPILNTLPAGINIIVPTVAAAAIGAWLFPMQQHNETLNDASVQIEKIEEKESGKNE